MTIELSVEEKMGCCCSRNNPGNPDLVIDKRTVNDPILNRADLVSNYKKEINIPAAPLLGNTDITFQKINATDSSSDLDTKDLNEMLKTDDENDDENDDTIESNDDDDFEEEERNQQ